jgi:predicted DNA-binding protein YlxM (UPF0122 family)
MWRNYLVTLLNGFGKYLTQNSKVTFRLYHLSDIS